MANVENLIPNSERSPEEVRENGKKGGIKSGEVRKEKATFKKALEWLLESNISFTEGAVYEKLKKSGIKNIEKLNPTQIATIGVWLGAIDGNANNYKTLMETNNEIEEITKNHPNIDTIEEIVDNSNLEKVLYEANKH